MNEIETESFVRIFVLTKLQESYERGEWHLFRLHYMYFRMRYPSEAERFCDHLPEDARARCYDLISRMEGKEKKEVLAIHS